MNFDRLRGLLDGDGLRARAVRGTVFTFFGFGTQQFLRLLANLVLTRLLFPEAFGMMALVTVAMSGVQMFSDVGIQTAIVRSKRGDDPVFLNTAWTLRIIRGALLALIMLAIAGPIARFYQEPQLAELLAVTGLNAVILGFQSTKLSVANRHLVLGRLTGIELASQIAGILAMIALAYLTESVWALVIGGLITSAVKTGLSYILLPGHSNRLAWEKAALWELVHFGKYIIISSTANFLANNADRLILGKFITIGELGIYNIGFFPASVPLVLTQKFGNRVLLPIYSKTPPRDGPENRRKIRTARALLAGMLVGLGLFLALIGNWFVTTLYSADYALAGPIMMLLSLSFLPQLATNAYGILLLSAGNSRSFTVHLIALAFIQLMLFLILVQNFGLLGATLTPALATFLVYPLTAWLAHREGGWDPLLDLGFLIVITLGAAGVLSLHGAVIGEMMLALSG